MSQQRQQAARRTERERTGSDKNPFKNIWREADLKGRVEDGCAHASKKVAESTMRILLSKCESGVHKIWSRCAEKVIHLCEDEGVDPRFYIVSSMDPNEQYDAAKAMEFDHVYEKCFECPPAFYEKKRRDKKAKK